MAKGLSNRVHTRGWKAAPNFRQSAAVDGDCREIPDSERKFEVGWRVEPWNRPWAVTFGTIAKELRRQLMKRRLGAEAKSGDTLACPAHVRSSSSGSCGAGHARMSPFFATENTQPVWAFHSHTLQGCPRFSLSENTQPVWVFHSHTLQGCPRFSLSENARPVWIFHSDRLLGCPRFSGECTSDRDL
jgi:hypothetical protein